MGFFLLNNQPERKRKAISTTLLHAHGCAVCPLNKCSARTPKMEPHGAEEPEIYILGEYPSLDDDETGRHFASTAGEVLRLRMPRSWLSRARWNHIVRCNPGSREPAPVEIEACRMHIIRDIEKSRPTAIFGFGNIALHWFAKQNGVAKWTGRRIPVRVGSHACWFYPFMHPRDIYNRRRFTPDHSEQYGCDEEFAFALHIEQALREIRNGLPPAEPHTVEDALENIKCYDGSGADDLDHVIDFMRQCDKKGRVVGLDYETNMLRPYSPKSRILTVGLSSKEGTIAFAVRHRENGWSLSALNELDRAYSTFLHEARCTKVSFGLPFEMEWSAFKYGSTCLRRTRWDDAQSQAYVLDERPGTLSLDFLCLQYFGLNLKAISNVDREKLDETPLDIVLRYQGLDAKYHRLLFLKQKARIEEEGLEELYEHHLRRVPTMVLTQLKGIPVNKDRFTEMSEKYERRLQDIHHEINKMPMMSDLRAVLGHAYNPLAERDVRAAFKTLDIPIVTTQKGEIGEVDHPLAKLTIKYRETSKILSTYVYPCQPNHPNSQIQADGMIHPIFPLHKTRTSRTSSEDPNAQNYPKRDAEAKEVRSGMHDETLKCVSFDYAGIQARNVAMESLDKALKKAFWHKYDIHADWTERIAKQCPDWAEAAKLAADKKYFKDKRSIAKNKFVFPSFFGAHHTSLARYLNISEWDAEALHDEFWDMFPSIKSWHKKIKRDYYRNGYVTGHAGYKRHAPISINELINAPIQADEARIVLTAMSELSEYEDPRFQANIEIHDDLTFWWPKHEIEKNSEIVIEHMLLTPYAWAHTVPIEVEMSIGDDWKSLEEVGKFETKGGVTWHETKS